MLPSFTLKGYKGIHNHIKDKQDQDGYGRKPTEFITAIKEIPENKNPPRILPKP